jgi:hypothetical protein
MISFIQSRRAVAARVLWTVEPPTATFPAAPPRLGAATTPEGACKAVLDLLDWACDGNGVKVVTFRVRAPGAESAPAAAALRRFTYDPVYGINGSRNGKAELLLAIRRQWRSLDLTVTLADE